MVQPKDKLTKYLVEWAENYFRSRDAFHKNIISIKHTLNGLIIEFKDKKENILAILDLINLEDSDITENTNIITLNNRKNIDTLYDKWNKIVDFSSLKLYFINPLSTTEEKWIINPYVHAKIYDKDSLKQGLISMFETVEPLTEEILKAKL